MLCTPTLENMRRLPLPPHRVRDRVLTTLALLAAMAHAMPSQARAQVPSSPQLSANDRMLEPGKEARQLARRAGTWDVVMRLRPSPDAKPVEVGGLIAERTMIGLYLQESDSIVVYFENSALAGFGPEFEGRLFRARHVTTRETDDRDVSRQYWTRAGGAEWLAVEYDYRRRR